MDVVPAVDIRSPNLRVALVVQKPQRRGAEVFARDLARSFRERGVEVRTIYLYALDGDEESRLDLQDCDRCIGADESRRVERLLGFNPAVLRRLRAELRQFNPDIVQVNGARTVKYGALARTRNDPWTVVYRNIGDPDEWVRGRARRTFYRRVIAPRIDAVVGVSTGTLAATLRFYGRPLPNRFIPTGVDTSAVARPEDAAGIRERLSIPIDARVVIAVASLTHEKRVDRFLRVIAAARRDVEDLHAIVVGSGPLLGDLQRQASELDLQDHVHLVGASGNVPAYLAAADLLLLTSDTEGIPGAVLEAAVCGLPTVATHVGGLQECIVDGVTGRLVPPNDEVGLAHAVVELLDDPPGRRAMGDRAAAHVRAHFAIDVVADAYLDFYTTLPARGVRASAAHDAVTRSRTRGT